MRGGGGGGEECGTYLEPDAVVGLLDVVELVEELAPKLVRYANHIRPQLLHLLEPPSAIP